MLNLPDQRLALQAYEQVLEMILSGRARPGELVNERRLAEALSMSRTPVRDALLMLEGEGLLVRQGSRGLQVKAMKVEDFMEALQIRRMLEPEVARLAAGRVDPGVLDAIAARLDALMAGAGRAGGADREEVRAVDNGLHGAIADAAGNAQLGAIIRTLRRQTQMFDLRSLPERLVGTCGEHLAIIAALRAGDGERAAAAMRTHLEQVGASIIARLSRL
ncbi:MAG: GntR family transcriptional regulator [Rhodobacteraceae bacterium]|jgi:DNA-binding GntR family transcriptional regulator|nr:GntR family transcriptional regulator [Paracoccaceae bacterium]